MKATESPRSSRSPIWANATSQAGRRSSGSLVMGKVRKSRSWPGTSPTLGRAISHAREGEYSERLGMAITGTELSTRTDRRVMRSGAARADAHAVKGSVVHVASPAAAGLVAAKMWIGFKDS